MVTQKWLRRAILVLGAIGGLSLGLAPVALAASPPYSVSLTQFSKAVSGVAPAGVTSVTVNLLRNTLNAGGGVVRNQIDTFTAPPTAGGWSGSFASHQFSGANDQVEVNYSPAPAADLVTSPATASPAQLTIGSGNFLATADQEAIDAPTGKHYPTAESVGLDPTAFDKAFQISWDGKTITCSDTTGLCSNGFKASVAGGTAQTTTGSSLSFATPVTSSQPIEVTGSETEFDGTTQISLSVPGPQLGLQEALLTSRPGVNPDTDPKTGIGLPSCQAYLVLSEVVCSNLTPGSYTLADGSSSQTITVPNATVKPPSDSTDPYAVQSLFVPSEAGAAVPGLAGGQTVTLKQGTLTLTTLTVDALKFNSSHPLGDLLKGSNAATTASCTADLFLGPAGDPDLCTSTGALPSPNNTSAGGLTTSLSEQDETSLGSTTVQLPTFALQEPFDGSSLFTPFVVTAMPRYTDPLAAMAEVNVNTQPPGVGPAPIIPSTASTDGTVFSYAPLGSTTFTTLGNANVAGGVQLPPTLPIGWYDGRWTVTDPAGNSYSFDSTFYNEGSTVSTLAAPVCSVKVKGGALKKATIAAVSNKKATKGKKKPKKAKKPKKPITPTATFSCTATSGARVALWIQRGTTVIADGSGIVKKGKVKIVMTGKSIKNGTYQLVEVIDLNGHSTEADKTLTLKKK